MMRNEVIKLTDEAIYPELIKLLSENGDVWGDMLTEYKHNFKILFKNERWTRAYPQYKADYTITDVDFIQKYRENTEPGAAPAWSFKTDEELKNFVATFLATKGDFEQFLSSIRKPAFELICQDGVVTDPEQIVWFFYNDKQHIHDTDAKSAMEKGRQCFTTKQAAVEHRLQNTPAIKLSDMTLTNDNGYWIRKDVAENLVNERINGK